MYDMGDDADKSSSAKNDDADTHVGDGLEIDVEDDVGSLEVVERGEMDRIWRMLYELESGQPG